MNYQSPPIIMGLYFYKRNKKEYYPTKTLKELKAFFKSNSNYIDELNLLFLAGDDKAAELLKKNGLNPYRVFNDAPEIIQENSAHFMKHWMVYSMLQEYSELLWLDWDVIFLKKLDTYFWKRARDSNTPKFIKIDNYWAFVNCGVYYVNKTHKELMKKSFEYLTDVKIPNDELLWTRVLKDNHQKNIWWGSMVINIWDKNDLNKITNQTYLLHIRSFEEFPYYKIRKSIISNKKRIDCSI